MQTQHVQTVKWARFAGKKGVRAGDAFGQSLATVLQNEARYELDWVKGRTIVNNLPGWQGSDAYQTLDLADDLRALACVAYSVAAMLKTGIYSRRVAGVSEAEAIHLVELGIRGAVFLHAANTPSKTCWGQGTSSEWQAAAWASHFADAAWWLWDDLSRETKVAVAKLVERDSDAFINRAVPYWTDRNRRVVFPGDTKAEENGWNLHLLGVAQAMMPNHPNVALWRRKASEYQISTYSRQSDLTNTRLVDGKPVKDWLNGYNAFDDGIVINHDIIHPDYMQAQMGCFASMVDVSLAEQYVPQSMVFNADVAYQGLTEVQFTPGADTKYGTGRKIATPGGTIYRRATGGGYTADVYYPQGTDWTTKVTDCYLSTDLNAEHLGFDDGKGFDAMGWAQARVDALRALQTRPGHDGNIYQAGDWIPNWPIPFFDAVIFQSSGQAWMQWWLMQNRLMSPIGDHWGPVAESSDH